MKKIVFILTICTLFSSCLGWGVKNDVNVKASGQFYIEQDGELMPFQRKMTLELEFKLFSEVSYGVSTYSQYAETYSDENGHFSYELVDIGGKTVRMHSFYKDADTILYRNDTILKFTKKNTLSDMQLVVTSKHTFNPTITAIPRKSRILYGDSCLFTINHDCLTHIEVCSYEYDGSDYSYIGVWETDVENVPFATFVVPDYFQEHELRNFVVKYTTLHYGTWISQGAYLYPE